MPFTLAHPAAVIPIHRTMASRTSLSALVIGSMMPDLVYFIQFGISVRMSHSLRGIVPFSIPVGLIAFALFHLLFKRPCAALLPERIRSRLSPKLLAMPRVDGAYVLTVILSLGLGAFTHVAWDAFTHANTFMVNKLAFLRMVLASIGNYQLQVYKLLQHASSVCGLLLLALWTLRWARTTPPASDIVPGLSFAMRVPVLAIIIATGAAGGVANGVSHWAGSIERVPMDVVVGALSAIVLSTGIFCLVWHVVHLARDGSNCRKGTALRNRGS